jgi:nicotinamide mononucleotide transporter
VEYIEHIGTVLSLAYVILLMMNKVWAWPCGILGSVLIGITLFTNEKPLYMETGSYIVYTIMGIYGWYHWVADKGEKEESLAITEWKVWHHVIAISLAAMVGIFIGDVLSAITNASSPYFDSLTTIFAMLGTWMQARKVLSNWVYWFFINLASVKLYWSNDFNSLPFLALIFTALSVSGFLQWLKIYRAQNV